ncbi:MAG: lamin tail domain-containing protein, partial [Bacteroidota bacterium]|nr:lamin tail domain-containing protein [Bacteroidota bacterium]
MNRIAMYLYVQILCLLYINPTFAQTTIWNENFETEGNGTRYQASSTFWTDNNTCFTRTDGTNVTIPGGGRVSPLTKYLNIEGLSFWAASNCSIIDPLNPSNNKDIQTIVFPDINIEGYSGLRFTGIFAAGDCRWLSDLSCSYDLFTSGNTKGLDFVKVTYSVDNGAETNGLQFSPALNPTGVPNSREDGALGWDSNFDKVADNKSSWLTSTFKSYSIENIPCGKKLTLKVYVRMNDVGECVAFDDFKITGLPYSSYLQTNAPLTDRGVNATNVLTDVLIKLKNINFSTKVIANGFRLVNAPPNLSILDITKDANAQVTMRLKYTGTGLGSDYKNFRVAIGATQIKENIAVVTDPFTIYACLPPTFELNQPQILNGIATLSGIVNSHCLSSAITLEYGETVDYGKEIPVSPSPVDGTTVVVTAQPDKLKTGQIYHYRFKGSNLKGTGYSEDATFSLTPVPKLIISEICDPLNDFSNNRFIEIYNAGDVAIDLSAYRVRAVCNNESSENIWSLSGIILPGQAKVCGKTGATSFIPDFTNEWSAITDWDGEPIDGGQLYYGSFLIDDFSGMNFSDKHAVRNAEVRLPVTLCSPDQWSLSDVADADKQGTPGHHGTEIVWTGKSNSDWNEVGNWQPLQIPTELDAVRIPGNVPNIPDISTSVQTNSLTLESDASINKPENIKTSHPVLIKRSLIAKEWQYFTPPFAGITAGDLLPTKGDLYLIQYNNNKSAAKDDINKGWDYVTDVKTPLTPGVGYGIWVTEPC